MLQPESHVRVGGEVKNKIAPGHRRGERGQIEAIAPDQFEPGLLPRVLQEFILAGGKIVVAGNRFAVPQQPVNEIAPDETRSARDKDFIHDWARSVGRTRPVRQPFWNKPSVGRPGSAGVPPACYVGVHALACLWEQAGTPTRRRDGGAPRIAPSASPRFFQLPPRWDRNKVEAIKPELGCETNLVRRLLNVGKIT